MADKFGYITQVIGPVVDVAFEGEGNDVPPAPPFPVTEGPLAVTDCDVRTERLLVADAAGRVVLTLAPRDTVDVSPLAPGRYELLAEGRKGMHHPLLHFWKR